ncbi:helix-turn-helix domain-containing protein [Streptomyces griseofuscus]|uniref:helix-turn-helix domain-containing protein n=1 Tax=Streptomyces griseofuscus TaxID=146922 RepID=UPI0011890134|nr:hypothetical protein SRO_0448 [Streptomyces rochei]
MPDPYGLVHHREAAGTVTTTTARGTWVAPANHVTWTPPGFAHAHRFYDRTDARLLTASVELCGELLAGAGERTLSRLFHRELDMGFHRRRTILRIHHALAHLADGMSVTDTAMASGWSTLLRRGIGCVVLERHGRAYVEQRQRAGALDAGGVRVLNEWGVGEAEEDGRCR